MLVEKVDSLTTMVNDTAEQRNRFRAHADTLAVEVKRYQREVAQLQDQASELQKSVDTLLEQQAAKDAEQEQVRKRWTRQLEQAEIDFNEMRQQLIPPAGMHLACLQLLDWPSSSHTLG